MLTPKIIQLPKVLDARGNLSFIEGNNHIPFKIERTFWMYDVPGGMIRGGHAYRQTEEFIIALSGSFDVVINDGINKMIFCLNRSYYGLYIPEMTWHHFENFSTNSLSLVLSSAKFDKNNLIKDFEIFKTLITR